MTTNTKFAFKQSVPNLPAPENSRDNILNTIDQLFQENNYLVILEAPDGTGKTTTAAQYAHRHSGRAFTLFIRPESRWAYDPEIVRLDLCNQIAAATNKPLPSTATTDAIYRTHLVKFKKWLANSASPATLIVDGLTELPETDSPLAMQIWDSLPIGLNGLNTLLTKSSTANLPLAYPKQSRTIRLPDFSPEETKALLQSSGLSGPDADKMYLACRGKPTWVQAIIRLFQSGIPSDKLIEEMSAHLSTLLDLEWSQLKNCEPPASLALAFLVHDSRDYTLDDLRAFGKNESFGTDAAAHSSGDEPELQEE